MSKCRYCGHPKEACACSEELGGMVFYKKDYVEGLEAQVAALKEENSKIASTNRDLLEKAAVAKRDRDIYRQRAGAAEAERDRLKEDLAVHDKAWIKNRAEIDRLKGEARQLRKNSQSILQHANRFDRERRKFREALEEAKRDAEYIINCGDTPFLEKYLRRLMEKADRALSGGEGEGKFYHDCPLSKDGCVACEWGDGDGGCCYVKPDEPREAEGQDSTE